MDSAIIIGIVYALLVLIMLASRMWISTALGFTGIIGLYFVTGSNSISMIGELLFNTTNHFTYTMMPLFVFMGELIKHSGMSSRLYNGASQWVRSIPGGLLHSNIISSALFSAISGSSMATAATIGSVAIPELEKRKYDRRIIFGSLAGGGTLGILIPPSLGLIIYGSIVGDSIGQLFFAGVLPGILISALFMSYIALMAIFKPDIAPMREHTELKGILLSIKDIFPILILIFIVLGTIYLGIASPTEAAALGAFTALILTAFFKKLNWNVLKGSLLSSLEITLYLMIIVIGAYILSMAFSMERIPAVLADLISGLKINRYVIWGILVVMYITIGAFIDGISILLLTVPVVHPIMMALGFDSIWLGIVLTVCIEMGQITPPVGVNLFVIHGLSKRKYFKEIIWGSIPFVLIQVLAVIILTIFPFLATWLPSILVSKF